MAGIKVITGPTSEQITMAEARLHLRLDDDGDSPPSHPDDAWLSGVGIPAARDYCERWMHRAIGPQMLELALDEFPPTDPIELPGSPVLSVVSLKYTDAEGTVQTLATSAYDTDLYSEPGLVTVVSGTSWPTAKTMANAVKVRYTVGFSLTDDSPLLNPLPPSIKAAMLLVLGALYENRENSSEKAQQDIPLGAHNLMLPYRLRLSMA